MLFSITLDSANSLAMKDPLDVGALSCQATRTCIHAVTAWHLLFPTSQTRTAIGPPHDWLSCCQEQYGVSTFRISEFVGLGTGSRPGSQLATRSHSGNDAPASSTFFGQALKPLSLVSIHDLYHRFTCVHLTNYLARILHEGGRLYDIHEQI